MKKIIKPCGDCPYKKGLIKTLTKPCPQCAADNYSAFDRFMKHINKDGYIKQEDGKLTKGQR